MYKKSWDSTKLNNFFTFITIILVTGVLMVYIKYAPKPQRLNSKLPCQMTNHTIDKISNDTLLLKGFKFFNQGNYVLDGGYIKPRFGKSYLKDKIDFSKINTWYEQSIKKNAKPKSVFLKIKYEIIENDKNNPRNEDKLSAGELLTSFRINGQEAFMMSTKFLNYDKITLKNKIECTINAFKYNAKK